MTTSDGLPADSPTEVEWHEPTVEHLNAKGAGGPLPLPIGFGCTTTGGHQGEVLHVRKPDDTLEDPAEGTLRWAVNQAGATWVVFEKDLHIELEAPLHLTPDTTLDGRGHAVTIHGGATHGVLRLEDVANVVVTNLTIAEAGDHDSGNKEQPHDAVYLKGAHRVWLDHLDLSRATDKAIGISLGSTDVSATCCHFHDQKTTFQVGNMTHASYDVDQTVTVAWCWFDHCGLRMPVTSYGKTHAFNNYYDEWGEYAVRSQRIAQTFLEANVFRAGADPSATLIHPSGDGANDANSLEDDRDGYLYDTGNLYLNKCKKQSTGTEHMFNPKAAYAYTAAAATEQLADQIKADAGPTP